MTLEVRNAHAKRQCHPETCSCITDWVVVEDGFIIDNVETIKEGEKVIEILNNWGIAKR